MPPNKHPVVIITYKSRLAKATWGINTGTQEAAHLGDREIIASLFFHGPKWRDVCCSLTQNW